MSRFKKIKPLKGEFWKDIPGLEGLYQASNMGRIKSLNFRRLKGRVSLIKQRVNHLGYCVVSKLYLFKGDGSRSDYSKVHRIIAITFLKKIKQKNEVNHKNGVKTDNRVENLEWCSRSENMKHAHEKNLNRTVTTHALPKAIKANSKKVIDLKTKKIYSSVTSASKRVGLSKSCLGAMLRGQNPNKTNLRYLSNAKLHK